MKNDLEEKEICPVCGHFTQLKKIFGSYDICEKCYESIIKYPKLYSDFIEKASRDKEQ